MNLGFPDCVIAFGNTSRFVLVEGKVIDKGLAIDLRPHQISFHIKHASLGCPTFILVEFWPRNAEKELRLYKGAQAIELKEKGMRLAPAHCWPLRAVNWAELQEIIS